ncbi:AdoMet-homocysteine methyltransferase [Paramarasmius palmivorus]|uniref:AdoMet-homocysteine methyltransferase n=1 Tax=Paramarasmius palmivorus TaxID=297713 RepID=A0AAW0CVN0_9AGAR
MTSFLSLTLIGSGVAGKSPHTYRSNEFVTDELTPKDSTSTPGWMAIGLGQSMIGTPMVVLWSNSDGSITLSQRQASGYAEPKVIQNPDRVAALVQASSSASSGNTKFTFTIPSDGKTTQSFIWAWGDENPGSSNIDATIQQHRDKGRASLNLAKDPSATTPSTGSGGNGNSNTDSSEHELPLLPYQKLIVAHAIFCVIGFLLLLPAGTLLARYLRTFTDTWFKGHWIIQFLLAGPAIVVGIAMGIQAVAKAGAQHLDDTHKKWGIAIFVLYLVQCSLGAFIHFVKPSKPGRPPQNYFHAVLGLFIIGSALYQVRTGYADEWPKTTGREEITGANTLWIIWVVLLPILYAAGLAFLPKQYKQEGEKRNRVTRGDFEDEDDIHMMPSNTYKDY